MAKDPSGATPCLLAWDKRMLRHDIWWKNAGNFNEDNIISLAEEFMNRFESTKRANES